MTTTRRLTLALAVVYVGTSGFLQISDAIIAGRLWSSMLLIAGIIGMTYAIFDEILKDVTK